MKKLIYTFIIMMSVFIGIDGVKADNEERKCEYLSSDGLTKAYVEFKDVLGIFGAHPGVNFFNGKSDSGLINVVTILNSNNITSEYKKNKSCFKYLLVVSTPGSGYSVYLSNNLEDVKMNAEAFGNNLIMGYEVAITELNSDSQKPNDDKSDNSNESTDQTDDSSTGNYKYGCAIFGDTLVGIIKEVYGYFKWIIPVLVVILSMLDFIKVVTSGKDDDFKKAQNNLVKRIILAIVFFIVPGLISFMIEFSGITEQFTNGDSILEAIACIFK